MFDNCKNTNLKGNVGLGQCIAYLTKLGYIISLPLNDSQSYDLIFDDGVLYKVQVKTTNKIRNNSYVVKLASETHNYSKHFNNKDSDFLFILCGNKDMYLIPTINIEAKASLNLGEKYKKWRVN